MKPEEKPLGYWLRSLDRLIENSFDEALASGGLSRRHWQLMDLLRAHPAHPTEIAESMWPFWGEGDPGPDEVVLALVRRGWAAHGQDGRLTLTLQGETAREEIGARVERIPRALTAGITTEEYGAVVDTLRRMADNLAKADRPA
ncbi:MarR family transcriptional regulator [Planosporangium mesophilum]|uniref:MarR family transcriptional regulator n=1 Tax=Planosporangium mesophilum TaxID=689768 RepID=A0A8J3TGB3_9ACTN|nr:MarR family transcriptional regulator [Planosporangium mesophilum]NJC82634.1 MarR family transcriptional regulator [Planosporangium mesophilum]GII25001.1 hypothetical protein Pme01_45980 [Planosporangium mesophilum]